MIPITIYEIRENLCHVETYSGTDLLVLNSDPRAYYQTMMSAQIAIQEMLDQRIDARLESAERFVEVYQNSPEAIAKIAANKLAFDFSHYNIQNITAESFAEMPIFYITEIIVQP